MRRVTRLSSTLVFTIAVVACGGTSDPSTPGEPPDPEDNVVSQTFAVSECNGFGASTSGGAASYAEGEPVEVEHRPDPSPAVDTPTPSDYCAAERLEWHYAEGQLTLLNTRVMLNCCGEHSVKLEKDGDIWVLHELDEPEMITTVAEPEPHGSRCRCMCPFDFELTAEEIPAGKIQLRLMLEVTDEGAAPQGKWEGELDLSAGSGAADIDLSDAFGFCE